MSLWSSSYNFFHSTPNSKPGIIFISMPFIPRPDQQRVLEFLDTGGYLGVSAVPGSGKTAILSFLAAELVRQRIRGEEEVLIVTFANSAVDNFARRIRGFLATPTGQPSPGEQASAPLLPDVGY